LELSKQINNHSTRCRRWQ